MVLLLNLDKFFEPHLIYTVHGPISFEIRIQRIGEKGVDYDFIKKIDNHYWMVQNGGPTLPLCTNLSQIDIWIFQKITNS